MASYTEISNLRTLSSNMYSLRYVGNVQIVRFRVGRLRLWWYQNYLLRNTFVCLPLSAQRRGVQWKSRYLGTGHRHLWTYIRTGALSDHESIGSSQNCTFLFDLDQRPSVLSSLGSSIWAAGAFGEANAKQRGTIASESKWNIDKLDLPQLQRWT